MINISEEVWILANNKDEFICKNAVSKYFISKTNLKQMIKYTSPTYALNSKRSIIDNKVKNIEQFVPKKVTIIIQDKPLKNMDIDIKESL